MVFFCLRNERKNICIDLVEFYIISLASVAEFSDKILMVELSIMNYDVHCKSGIAIQ